MKNLDDAIKDALGQEDAEFLARLEEEPGSFRQMADIFRGPLNWIYVVLLITAILLGIFGVYSAWRFAVATELRPLFHWGALAGFCLVVLAVVRVLFFMQIHTNRILREMKRLELQVALLARQRT
jgi:cellobiose-specific phosphotransferase system component IIC